MRGALLLTAGVVASCDGPAYDDCGVGLLCVSGTCREYVEGHAPELRVCVP